MNQFPFVNAKTSFSPFARAIATQEFAWLLIALFGITTLGGIAGAPRLVNLLYPLEALLLGLFLYLRFPILYLGLTWWLWILSPLVRRLVDYRSAFTQPSPVLLAPILVSLISGLTLLKCIPRMNQLGGLPYLLALSSICFTYALGLVNFSFLDATEQFLDLLIPLTFGFHIYTNWQLYPQYKQNLRRVFVWAVIVMGGYGVFQFLTAPAWDAYWYVNADYVSGGQPEPFAIRVWSTLNSAGPFAGVMMSGLLILLDVPGPQKYLASGLGFMAFLLSQHRTSWLGWVLGILTITGSSTPKRQIKLLITLGLLVLFVIFLANLDLFSEVISSRFGSFLSLEEDGSGRVRREEYAEFLTPALSQIVGNGLGGLLHDSGILYSLLNFGWIALLIYLGGLFLPLLRLFQSKYAQQDMFLIICRSIPLSILIQSATVVSFLGVYGFLLWVITSYGIAGDKYYFNLEKNADYLGKISIPQQE
ncbi:O-antigen ligase domain-containing protein [Lyngbya confervoides]|uniref:O-antigen ligase domain-containing protein n=1 Tax=Lyngbya confervoides BDU141951 TaxID=1574623 RepID=A0ABD4T1A8_9CYAN|nr:O-antigen ligase domain-containing protein [Lyngbya confervoides]MCM1982385.1 O-antigen ligase domain-containing protein [Lyngbya confervoides BDU141951]